ncbi:MAG: Gfo/Idh/MocA family oxidoreductase, partial [Deltaproteobacteria bacterium]|nr:Gfo/Idh/MocA family oxidoreductase [Deltaproteobacteria bacterium]
MKKVKVGLIGLGNIADLHLPAYRGVKNIEVVAGVEINPDRRSAMANQWGFRGYADIGTMLEKENLDIACILTPASLHRAHTEQVAAAGVHILCEKPIAVTLEDANAMISAGSTAGVKFFYGSSYRSLPACIKAKEMIEAGLLGDIVLITESYVGGNGPDDWQDLGPHHYPIGGPGGGGLGLVDHGIHMVDLFPWFAGTRVNTVFGKGNYSG